MIDSSDAADAERFRWLIAGRAIILDGPNATWLFQPGEEDQARFLVDDLIGSDPDSPAG
jgi:hypothetical protein